MRDSHYFNGLAVVEEGVDVQACSFVAVFDTLKNTKGYIQMKGRARQKNAKFFVFQAVNSPCKASLSLSLAQEMERRVHAFIRGKSRLPASSPPLASGHGASAVEESDEAAPAEVAVLESGFYKVKNGIVDLVTAKSLLNRYILSVPLDPFARSSKESLVAHMPVYERDRLILPAHLPRKVRVVSLPEKYSSLPKKKKHKMLALRACVRLHSYGLLNDRLLPLTRKDMQAHILRVATKDVTSIPLPRLPLENIFSDRETEIYVYPIHQTSPAVTKCNTIFQGDGHTLALVTFHPIHTSIPPFALMHGELGEIQNSLGEQFVVGCSPEQRSLLSETFILLMNERWRRRSRNMYFRTREMGEFNGVVAPYVVGILSSSGNLDWDFMDLLLKESLRSKEERISAVRSASCADKLPKTRLWTPLYDEYTSYLVYGPSGEDCSSIFPHEKEGIETYHDYFTKLRGFDLPQGSKLFEAQRLWSLPSNLQMAKNSEAQASTIKTPSSKYDVCQELATVKLAQEACLEATLANAHVAFLCCMLPQFLFVFERFSVATAFLEHCRANIPALGQFFSKLPIESVMIALTAKSCSLEESYEKLEWFGDAVLKLVQTDSLLMSSELQQWVAFLHEGDLSTLRSGKIELTDCHNCRPSAMLTSTT